MSRFSGQFLGRFSGQKDAIELPPRPISSMGVTMDDTTIPAPMGSAAVIPVNIVCQDQSGAPIWSKNVVLSAEDGMLLYQQ